MVEGLVHPTQLILIAIVALIVLGPAKLGDLSGAMGRSVREFKENVDVGHPASTSAASLKAGDRLALKERVASTEGVHATHV